MTLPSRHRIRNSSPGGLRPSTLPLSHGGSSAPHNLRSPDFSSRPPHNLHQQPPSPPPKLLQLGVHQFQKEINKNVYLSKNDNKRDNLSCCGQVLSIKANMGSVIMLITQYDCAVQQNMCMLDFLIN